MADGGIGGLGAELGEAEQEQLGSIGGEAAASVGGGSSESWQPSTSGGAGDHVEDFGRSDVELLRRVWSNEKAAPEVLRYEAHLVERVQEQIQLMEENIAAYSTEINDELMLSLYRMDVNRTLFLLRSYLRTRLSKIEKFAIHIISSIDVSQKLSESELEYAFKYGEATAKHFELTVLSRLPDEYNSMSTQYTSSEEGDMIPRPPLDTFVFCKSKGAIGALQLDDKGDETVDLMKDDLHILRYRPISLFLETKEIELI